MWSGVWWTPIHWSLGGSSWHVVWSVMNTHTLVSRWQQLTCGLECDEHPYTGLQVAAADMWSGVWWTPIHWSPGGSSWHVVWSVMNTHTLVSRWQQLTCGLECDEHHCLMSSIHPSTKSPLDGASGRLLPCAVKHSVQNVVVMWKGLRVASNWGSDPRKFKFSFTYIGDTTQSKE